MIRYSLMDFYRKSRGEEGSEKFAYYTETLAADIARDMKRRISEENNASDKN